MQRNKKMPWYVWLVLALPVFYCGLLIGQYYQEDLNLAGWLEILNTAFANPLAVKNTPYGVKCGLVLLAAYGMGILYYYANSSNTRKGEEHGSARWANVAHINARYRDRPKKKAFDFKAFFHFTKKEKQPKPQADNNIILSKNLRFSMNSYQHKRNLNVLCVGGSGAGKTRYFLLPNLMNCNCSFVITDPKSEILYATGEMFKRAGYKIKVLNLIDTEASQCYNPFRYLKTETDVLRLIKSLIKSTNEKGAKSSDPFWENAESALLQALIFYLLEAPESEQNFYTVAEMLEYARVNGEDDNGETELDRLFQYLEEENPEHLAVKQYKIFKQAGGKTAMSILVSAAVRLTPFNIPQIKRITSTDDMDIHTYGEQKTVCFAVIPDNSSAMNFLVSLLYDQLFQTLFYQADQVHKGQLPVHVRFMFEEYPNIKMPDDYEKILAVQRSRNTSSTIIVQGLSQLKALHEKTWEVVVGNCDSFVYLGGNENFTHEHLSKALGKETIDTTTRGITKGKSGSSNQNFQNAGRELLQMNEVRLLPNEESIVLIRGELPIWDKKYALEKHPNFKHIAQGGAPVFTDHIPPKPVVVSLEQAFDFSDPDRYSFFEDDEEPTNDKGENNTYEETNNKTALPVDLAG